MEETQLATIACSKDQLLTLLSYKEEGLLSTLKNFIFFDIVDFEVKSRCTKAGITLYTFDEVVLKGKYCDVKLEEP